MQSLTVRMTGFGVRCSLLPTDRYTDLGLDLNGCDSANSAKPGYQSDPDADTQAVKASVTNGAYTAKSPPIE